LLLPAATKFHRLLMCSCSANVSHLLSSRVVFLGVPLAMLKFHTESTIS
jgi:hypothetical protein